MFFWEDNIMNILNELGSLAESNIAEIKTKKKA